MSASVENIGMLGQWFKVFGLILLSCGSIPWLVVDHLVGPELFQGLVFAFVLFSVGISAKIATPCVCIRPNKTPSF